MYLKHNHMRQRAYDIKEIVEFLGIDKEWDIADLGAGDGVFSREFAKVARTVIAYDINDKYFNEMQNEGIKTVKADLCEPQEGKYDLVFMSNVYHGLIRRCSEAVLSNFERMSKKYVAIMDFNEKRLFGPPFRVKKEEIIGDMEKHGFELIKSKELEFHYLLLFRRRQQNA
ncbi:MAG: class I SAM-dependent methyltransferase [Nitrososphaeria archaeon]